MRQPDMCSASSTAFLIASTICSLSACFTRGSFAPCAISIGMYSSDEAKIAGMTPEVLILIGRCEDSAWVIFMPTWRFGYWISRRRCASSVPCGALPSSSVQPKTTVPSHMMPKSSTSDGSTATLAAVTVTADHSLLFNKVPVTEAELATKLRGLLAEDRGLTVIVSADTKADHGAVVHVLDVARVEGVTSFAVNVEKVAP